MTNMFKLVSDIPCTVGCEKDENIIFVHVVYEVDGILCLFQATLDSITGQVLNTHHNATDGVTSDD